MLEAAKRNQTRNEMLEFARRLWHCDRLSFPVAAIRREKVTIQSGHIQPYYLAAHGAPNTTLPSIDELDLQRAADIATRYSNIRSMMDLTVSSPNIGIPLAEDPWREVAGLFGSIAASLAITIPCEVEVEFHRRARESGDLPDAMVIGERFFSEGQAQKVIELGHRLINLGFRAFALRQDWKAAVSQSKYAVVVETPFSDKRKAWISLNQNSAKALSSLCASVGHDSAAKMGDAIDSLATSPEWKAVEEQRGQDFHRWRLESSVLAGVDASSSGARDLHDEFGEVIGKAAGAGTRQYTAGDGIDEKVAKLASQGLRRLTEALDLFADGFLACAEPLSVGAYSWSSEKGVFTRHMRSWDDTACQCAT